jgi:hypothetical protein
LEHGAGEIRGKRVVHLSVDPSLANKPLENVSHNDKKVGGERVTLPEAVTASDPIPRDPVKEDGGMAVERMRRSHPHQL